MLLSKAVTFFVLYSKCSCIAVLPLLEALLPSNTNFAALNLFLYPVHCWKEDWHFQLCWVFPIVTTYCFHRNPSKCFSRTWLRKEFCWHIYSARFLTTWLMSPQYSLLLKNKSKNVENIHDAATELSLSISRTLEFVSSFSFFPSHHSSTLSSFCPRKPFST